MNTDRIAELEAEILAIREADRKERQALLDSVKPSYVFTVTPASYSHFGDQCFDDAVTCYAVTGKVTNKDDLTAAGHSDRFHEGSMKYLFNTLSGKFITSVGGGSTFHNAGFGQDRKDRTAEFMTVLAGFVKANPEGGDITEVINLFR